MTSCKHLVHNISVVLLSLVLFSACSSEPDPTSPPAETKSKQNSKTPDEATATDTAADNTATKEKAEPDTTTKPKVKMVPPQPIPVKTSKTSPTERSNETRQERLVRLASSKPLKNKNVFDVQVSSLTLGVEGKGFTETGRRRSGIVLKLQGTITNNTGKTLTRGGLHGVLLLRFGSDNVRLMLSPDALKEATSPESPWRDTVTRKFSAQTYVLPSILMEYTPTKVEARLFSQFEDPIDYRFEAPVWFQSINWLAVRGAPVKGKAMVIKSGGLRTGPKGKVKGLIQTGETVELLYQKGEQFRVQANSGFGWVSNASLRLNDLSIYEDARPSGNERTVQDELVALKIVSLETVSQPPAAIPLKEGQRVLLVGVELTNKSDKDIRCRDAFYVDYGPSKQPAALRTKFDGTLMCDNKKLAPEGSAQGKIAFIRGRYDIPFAIGYVSPSKVPLIVDVYDPKEAEPYSGVGQAASK